MASARWVNTPARCWRYSAVPRLSLIGLAAWLATSPASANWLRVAGLPASHLAASGQSSGVGATAASATRACSILSPAAFSSTQAAAPDHGDIHFVARNESQVGRARVLGRGGKFERGQNFAAAQHVSARRVQNSATAHAAAPLGPAMWHIASRAISEGIESAAGDELHRLPPMLARL